jgi:hypothetical protein
MKYSGIALISIILLCSIHSSAQEVISPLNRNDVIIEYLQKNNTAVQRTASFSDTLILPFEDDFSRPGIYPFDSLWLDSGVYVNNNYSDFPVTIGVATFDGLNAFGRPYQPLGSIDSVADVLTSRPIDLNFPGDTSIWLSFFYEPQGLGDIPETGDSIVLQFADTGHTWITMWTDTGRSDTAFRRVNIRVNEDRFLYKGFQFRFWNNATVNGNRDHWNLDYVILKRFTMANDSIRDNALIRPQTSLLTEFTAMPYPHYKSLGNQLGAMKTSLNDTIYDINYGPTSYLPQIDILQNGTVIHSGGTGSVSALSSNSYIPYTIPLNNYVYPTQSPDSAEFLVKSYFSVTGTQSNRHNDTSFFYQRFHNYYAYDDGSAEASYSLVGNADVSVAYRFDIKQQDTLRGVQIYWNPVGDVVTNKLFQLTAWSNVQVNSSGGSAVQIYRMIDQKPDTSTGINSFKTYKFDSLIVVNPGYLWVGIIQNEPQFLYGIGLDRNTDSHNNIFFHVDGSWYNSSIIGSLMIRPIFGKNFSVVDVAEPDQNFDFNVYPNPSSDLLHVDFSNSFGNKYSYELITVTGAVSLSGKINSGETIDVSALSKGFYMLRLTNNVNGISSVRKVSVN